MIQLIVFFCHLSEEFCTNYSTLILQPAQNCFNQNCQKIADCYRKFNFILCLELLVKAKAIPLQAWRGAEVSSRLMLPDFKTNGT